MKEIETMSFMKQKNNCDIFHENDERFQELEEQRKKRSKIKKIAIYGSTFVVLASSVVLIKKQINYLNKPTTIVVNDILANEGLLETDNGKKVDPRKFDSEHLDEMYKYCREHNLDPATLRAQLIHEYIKDHKDVNEDMLMEQLASKYPGILNNDLIITVEHENKAK